MKKVFLLTIILAILGLSSCSVSKPKYFERVYSVDYSEYSKEGFFITESNSVSFDYEPLASIVVTMYQGEGGEWVYFKGQMINNSMSVSPSQALYRAVNEAKKIGANALINVKYTPTSINLIGIEQNGIMFSAMAVKK